MRTKRKKEGYVLCRDGPSMESELKRIAKSMIKHQGPFNASLMVVDHSDGSKEYVLTISAES